MCSFYNLGVLNTDNIFMCAAKLCLLSFKRFKEMINTLLPCLKERKACSCGPVSCLYFLTRAKGEERDRLDIYSEDKQDLT